MDYKLEVVVVPVSDVDRAKRSMSSRSASIWMSTISPTTIPGRPDDADGIGLFRDDRQGDGRNEPGSLKGLQLSVGDIEAAHADLASRGVPVSSVQHHDGSGFVDGPGEEYNSFIFFSDPDGNEWAVQQSPLVRASDGDAPAAG